ncbi:MAG TPA: hypothetical protein VJ891_09660 [Casimicrobiaceae bacterium]|nr:hypothetical protein [Casimicrobiaceae bacterium]
MTNDDMPAGVKLPQSVHDRAREYMDDGHAPHVAYSKALKDHLEDRLDDDSDEPRGADGGY